MAKNSLLTIDKLYRYEIALFMFKFHMKQLPSAFSDIVLMKKYSIDYRNNSSIIPMAYRISLSQQSIRYVGPKIWNEVPPSIRKCKTLSSFKSKLLVYFLNLNLLELTLSDNLKFLYPGCTSVIMKISNNQ